jgi:DNA-binding MurR/RpiR family transcriptional regulator
MLIDELKQAEHFTETERAIAAYILEHLKEIPDLSAETLAKNTYISKSAITRFCRKLRLTSYQELKKTLD